MNATHVTLAAKNLAQPLEFDTQMVSFPKRAEHANSGQARWLAVRPKA